MNRYVLILLPFFSLSLFGTTSGRKKLKTQKEYKYLHPNTFKTTEGCIDVLKELEGNVPTQYNCRGNKKTIGYGHQILEKDTCLEKVLGPRKIKDKFHHLTKEEAEKLLKEDVLLVENQVKQLCTKPITQNQFDALVCFTFNLGANSLKKSKLLKLINNEKYNEASNELCRWHKCNKKFIPGLLKRRFVEMMMFNGKDIIEDMSNYSPSAKKHWTALPNVLKYDAKRLFICYLSKKQPV